MRSPRIFNPGLLADDVEFQLDAAAARHLLRALRLKSGDGFVVFDGSGREWPACIVDGTHARTGRGTVVDRESPLTITLVQGISRGERMDDTIRKAVELGVGAIQPVFTVRSEVRLSGERMHRRVAHWQGIAVSACEQCGRTRVPVVAAPLDLHALLLAHDGTPGIVLHPAASLGLHGIEPPGGRFTLVAGPEGGLDDTETAATRDAGFVTVRLGPRVLRTETAAVAAIAAIQALWGDLAGAMR